MNHGQNHNLPPFRPLEVPAHGADFGHQFGSLSEGGIVSGLMYPENPAAGRQAEVHAPAPAHTRLGSAAVRREVLAPGVTPSTGLESYHDNLGAPWVRMGGASKIPEAPSPRATAPTSEGPTRNIARLVPANAAEQHVDEVTGEQKGSDYFRQLAVASQAAAEEPEELFNGIIGPAIQSQGRDYNNAGGTRSALSPRTSAGRPGAAAAAENMAKQKSVEAPQADEPRQVPAPQVAQPSRVVSARTGPEGVIGAEYVDEEDGFQGFGAQVEDFTPGQGDARTQSNRTYLSKRRHE